MVSPEDPKRPGLGELKLLVPSLIVPYPGVFREVLEEYEADPEVFRVAQLFRMKTDNSNLVTYVKVDEFSPNPDLAAKWSAIYYELFARSARRAGLPPLTITEQLRGELHDQRISDIVSSLEDNDDEGWAEEVKSDRDKRRIRDESMSPELVEFWQMVDHDAQIAGIDEIITMMNAEDLHALQTLLQDQDDLYTNLVNPAIN